MTRAIVLVLVTGFLVLPWQQFADRVNTALDERFRQDEPGIAVCAVSGGKIIYAAARGLANLDQREAMTPDTPVYVASLAKAFTTVAVLQLVEQRKLSLDDPVADHLPGLPAAFAAVTVRHLLTHTSGAPDYEDAIGQAPGVTNARVMTWVREQTALRFPAGSRWAYSNTGFVLLAEVFERVSGTTLAGHFQHAFFDTLGMTSTFVHAPETAGRAKATGYRKEGDTWVEDDYDAYTVGPGGVHASANDMCRWSIALDEGRLLKRMTLAAARTPHVHSGAAPTPMGLGFQVEDIPKGPLQGQWYAAVFGERDGFRATAMKLMSRDFAYVQLSNSSGMLEPMLVPNLFAGAPNPSPEP